MTKSIPALIIQRAASSGGDTILRIKDRGIWKVVSWSALNMRVSEIGLALLDAGFASGSAVAILSETRPEAVYADLGAQGCGAASVAIDPDEDTDRLCHLLSSSGARLAFVENEEQLDRVLSVRDRCPGLTRVVVFDMKGLRDFFDPGCVSLADFIKSAGSSNWAEVVGGITADQPAVIQFPQREGYGLGRMLSHSDVMHMVAAARIRLPIMPGDERLVVLRLSDITERVWGLYLALETRCISNYPEGPDTVIENLKELQPTVLGADALAWAHLHGLATAKWQAATAAQHWLYRWALSAGRLGGLKGQLANLLVLSAVRREFGLRRLRLAYVGGTSIGAPALDWARCLGIMIQRVDEIPANDVQLDERYQTLLASAYA